MIQDKVTFLGSSTLLPSTDRLQATLMKYSISFNFESSIC